ncbi:hypothetical protein EV215_0651 [Hypnocyclicus thermotrophus]|uniref:Restriction endonuclease subunit M n=1 Tax=Hypnocyclicus thermotrophus TaxID=1627895 RepID=A0AA46DZY0_9FUSO|nr:hypothetical protein EV215_0651 [Hypnocyclicus thermotrophus]
MNTEIIENIILEQYPGVLETLLRDHTTQKNIFWATNDYEHLGEGYKYNNQILIELITGNNGKIVMPRVKKDKILQQNRSKKMAEVFTPSWVCNAQNNLIDNAWFGRENIFNTEIKENNGNSTWKVNQEKITFPKHKTWQDYIKDTRLEITCGEAPYITSRYDTTTGEFIPIKNRIGLLDRKLRIINENVNTSGEWLKAAQIAYKNIYAFEWHGDNLLLARISMLITFIENYQYKFGKKPVLKSINYIAYIISWNVWQMDGIKGVIPNSCGYKIETRVNLFGEIKIKKTKCVGCQKNDIFRHNGIYCLIKDWTSGKKIRFIDLMKGYIK